ncbi:DUF397 domain-containing protein [Streptomyces sp. NPDC053542]|uniref:DUF397 domain-containing protein n=1 Tax=Streptomyces sp. NPDC053542 TaxID=3365710 RepID=UPI0037CDAF21
MSVIETRLPRSRIRPGHRTQGLTNRSVWQCADYCESTFNYPSTGRPEAREPIGAVGDPLDIERASDAAGSGAADVVHVRDSKAMGGPEMRVSGASWADFIAYAVSGSG